MNTTKNGGETSRVEVSKKLALINSASSLIALFLNITVLIWLQQFLLKRIDADEYSILPVISSIMMFMPLLTNLFVLGIGRYSTEAYAAGDTDRVTQISSTMFVILLGVGSVILSVGVVLTYCLDSILTIAPQYLHDAQIMLALLILSFCSEIVLAPFTVGLAIRQKFILSHIIATAGQFLRIALLSALLFGVSVKVLWVVVATIIATLVTKLVIIIFSTRSVPQLRFQREAINFPIAKQIMAFGGWSTIAGFAVAIRISADAIILNKLGTSIDVACFHLGSLPLRYINMIGGAAVAPLKPALIAMHTMGQPDRLSRVFLQGGRWGLFLTLIAVAPLMVFGSELITLYVGSEYQLAGTIMALLIVMFPLSQGVRMLFFIADASANNRGYSLSLLARSTFSLSLTLYLVGVLEMGALGAALGTAITMVLFYPLLFWPLGLKIGMVDFTTFFKKTLGPGLLPFIVSLCTLFGLKHYFSIEGWLEIIGCITIGSAFYILVLLTVCLQSEDKQDLKKVIQAIRSHAAIQAVFPKTDNKIN
jgi:O-antigen/teichoic acid export membrane protein